MNLICINAARMPAQNPEIAATSIKPRSSSRSRARASFASAPIAVQRYRGPAAKRPPLALCWTRPVGTPWDRQGPGGKIADIVKTGHFALLDTLKKKLPGELGNMAALPGLGQKRVKLLYDKLKVFTLDDLRRVLETGRSAGHQGLWPPPSPRSSRKRSKNPL